MKKGSHHTPEALAKMRASWTPEKRANQAVTAINVMKGQNNPMRRPGVRERHLAAMQRPEVRKKCSGDNSPTKRPEVRAKIAATMRGNRNPMKRPEVRAAHFITMQSPEVKAKHLAMTPRGDKHHMKLQEQRDKISGSKNPMSRPEVKAKHLAAVNSPEVKARHLAAIQRGGKHSSKRPEVQAKLSAAWTPERRAAQAEAMRGDKHPMKQPKVAAKVAAAKLGKKRPDITGDKNPAWRGGLSCEPYTWTFNDELKEEVRRRDDHQCQRCGVSQVECDQKLSVHHIDYDKKNSDPVNLTALCRSCNARVNTNRSYWTAFFQAMAIERDISKMSQK